MDALQRIPTKGKDPVMDAREKAFSRIATRWGSIPFNLSSAPSVTCMPVVVDPQYHVSCFTRQSSTDSPDASTALDYNDDGFLIFCC